MNLDFHWEKAKSRRENGSIDLVSFVCGLFIFCFIFGVVSHIEVPILEKTTVGKGNFTVELVVFPFFVIRLFVVN
jgi:hypothetical protein